MDFFPDVDTLSLWLTQYGSFVLFAALTLGIIALPVPEETLMVLAGVLMHQGKLDIPSTTAAAYLGCLSGISVSYIIGRLAGNFLLTKYGRFVGITEDRLKRAHRWFERFGKWTLPVGYFIPGVRHFTGFSAGTSKLHFAQFVLFAYSGALVWVSLFLSIGYFYGKQWAALFEKIDLDSALTIIIVIAALLLVYLSKKIWTKRK